ncbi:hypothetical protein A6F65_01367 [Paraurantiacibacter namhicola]|uniref:Uncharacterized protein n=1 Tax=Paraurantiacibacter namhicola TaxID=645517 RepID=A0A1C7D8Q3_9SPHN|nr:hypothetical protein A6F65_01367 [Paraurantiacibacter namhicola]
MSRSRRRTPKTPVTSAKSEKRYKAREHRRERAAVRASLATGDDVPPAKLFGNPWNGDKDGKLYQPDAASARRK